jgi:Pentapeptide repeats (8 copies)
VMEVLIAFIREHSREPWPLPDAGRLEQVRSTRPDVQAAATVVGRRDSARDVQIIDLTGVDLGGAYLVHANLSAAILSDSDLIGTILARADLSYSLLDGADLTGAVLTGANLYYAKLTGAKWPEDEAVPEDGTETLPLAD